MKSLSGFLMSLPLRLPPPLMSLPSSSTSSNSGKAQCIDTWDSASQRGSQRILSIAWKQISQLTKTHLLGDNIVFAEPAPRSTLRQHSFSAFTAAQPCTNNAALSVL